MANWYVGQKVVCVAGKTANGHFSGEIQPTIGCVYTIRSIIIDEHRCAFCLEEIVNRPRFYVQGFEEASFKAVRFRPVVTKEADISIFTEILDRVNAREVIDA